MAATLSRPQTPRDACRQEIKLIRDALQYHRELWREANRAGHHGCASKHGMEILTLKTRLRAAQIRLAVCSNEGE